MTDTGITCTAAIGTAPSGPRICVELYRYPGGQSAAGIPLEEWNGKLDAATWAWLREQGYDGNDPDLWVNIVPKGTWAPNNNPDAERWTSA